MATESAVLIEKISSLSRQPGFATDFDAQQKVSHLSKVLSMQLMAPEEAALELAYYVSRPQEKTFFYTNQI